MGGLCRTHGTDKKCTQGFWSVNLKGKDYTEDLDSWKDIGMDLREMVGEVVDRIHLAQERDPWCALLTTVTNLHVL